MSEEAAGPAVKQNLCILMPVFNDWPVAALMIGKIDSVLAGAGISAEVVVVDDGSTTKWTPPFLPVSPTAVRRIEIVSLRKNLGHQRALCVGLVHVQQTRENCTVIVMDADGEDAPEDIARLAGRFHEAGGEKVVFAARAKRAEGLVFRMFYQLFQTVHWLLVGFRPRIGNFSILPWFALRGLVVTPDAWNHYAAAIVKSKIPFVTIDIDRAQRLGGHSKMGLTGLIMHGLSAISVFGDVVGVRLLVASCALCVTAIAGLVATLGIRLGTDLAIPGWATSTVGLLLTLLMQSILLSTVFTFIVLGSRAHPNFLPVRDCPIYIDHVRIVSFYE